jgi:hypothetical protein
MLFFLVYKLNKTNKTTTDEVVSLFAASKIMKQAPNPK